MHVLLMVFDEDGQAQAALTTLGTAGIGPISAIPGVGFNGDGSRRQCLHAFCFIGDDVPIEMVFDLLMRTVGSPVGPFSRWAVLRATDVKFPDMATVFAEAA